MKKIIIAALLIASIILPVTAYADSHKALWISFGAGSDGTSSAMGLRGEQYGLEIGRCGTNEYEEGQLLDYPVPHSDYRSLGKHRIDDAYGFDTLAFYNYDADASLFAGLGLYFQKTGEIAQSNATGWLYTQSTDEQITIRPSVGVQIFPNGKWMFGLTYHTLRGITVLAGLHF